MSTQLSLGTDMNAIHELCDCAESAKAFSWDSVASRSYFANWKGSAATILASLVGGFVCVGWSISSNARKRPIRGKTKIIVLGPMPYTVDGRSIDLLSDAVSTAPDVRGNSCDGNYYTGSDHGSDASSAIGMAILPIETSQTKGGTSVLVL